MTDKIIEQNTLDNEISLDDIFQSDENVAEKEAEETIESEEQPTEDTEEVEEEATPEEPEDDTIAKLEKRLKDTQKFGHRQKNKADKVLAKMLEEGKISEEEYQAYNSDEEPMVEDLASELNNIEATTRKDLEVIAETFPDRDVKDEYESYVKLTQHYPKLAMELLDIPANKRLGHMLSVGSGAKDVLSLLDEHNGNVIDALRSNVGDDKVAAAEIKGYNKAKKEFEEQMAELSTSKRPKLRSAAINTIKEDDSEDDILGFL